MLDIAEELFARAPYESVHIDEVAEAADVSVGTVYSHFGSKEGLYLAIVDRIVDEADAMIDTSSLRDESIFGQMSAVGEAYLDLLLERPFIATVLVSEAALPADDATRNRIAAQIDDLYTSLARLVEPALISDGMYLADAALLARFLIGAWTGVIALSTRSGGSPVDVDELAACLNQGRDLLTEAVNHRLFTTTRQHAKRPAAASRGGSSRGK
ncbi:TetR/AcrR family transcriptional regulator [Mycolicibacterium sp. Y3]